VRHKDLYAGPQAAHLPRFPAPDGRDSGLDATYHVPMLSSAERQQRQLAPVRHGLYVRAANGRQLRDRAVQRLVSKLRQAIPWLTPSDLPAARAWCEAEVLSRLVFHELRVNGITTGQGEPRRLLSEYRQLRSAQLGYARELAMTPQARKALGADPGREGDAVENFRSYVASRDAKRHDARTAS